MKRKMTFYVCKDDTFRLRSKSSRKPKCVLEKYDIEITEEVMAESFLNMLYNRIKNGQRIFD